MIRRCCVITCNKLFVCDGSVTHDVTAADVLPLGSSVCRDTDKFHQTDKDKQAERQTDSQIYSTRQTERQTFRQISSTQTDKQADIILIFLQHQNVITSEQARVINTGVWVNRSWSRFRFLKNNELSIIFEKVSSYFLQRESHECEC